MASKRQIEANRKNAKRSTGPQTVAGKERSSRNSVRHGLARSAGGSEDEVLKLARSIADGLGEEVSQAISDFASSKVRLREVGAVRHRKLLELLIAPEKADTKAIRNLVRYERPALATYRRAFRLLG